MEKYQHKKIEVKWQAKWKKWNLYKTKEGRRRKKYYILDMFPYPSGAGLHVGHPKGYIATDVFARMKMMQGLNVLHPMGWDAFGLPAENYALKNRVHPRAAVEKNIATFKAQLEKLGFSYDWSREINTTDPEFYKWTQWIFLEMFKRGLAYESYEPINWCPSCKTGLANEDLENGKCERCGSEIERKPMRQWVLKITNYAERMLNDLEKLPYWDESIKEMQKNWIGRSEGALVKFKIKNQKSEIKTITQNEKIKDKLEVFTTRPDTLFGCSYVVVAPEHPILKNQKSKIKNQLEIEKYIERAKKKSDLERTDLAKEKTGVKVEGLIAINPVNNEAVPIFVADYVLAGYGTGAIMAVPAHDERDLEFARKYELPIRPVVLKKEEMSRSFLMGIDKQFKKHLTKIKAKIIKETRDGFLEVLIPFNKIEKYKSFVRKYMNNGFWNEFSTLNGFYFIFKDNHGNIEEYELNSGNNDKIDKLCQQYNNEAPIQEPENVYTWLAKNNFYQDILIHTNDGININSGFLDGLPTDEAKKKIIKWLEKQGLGEKAVNYKLQDWVFSRQRYWGEPIPLIFCERCAKRVKSGNLKINLPKDKKTTLKKFKIDNLEFNLGEILSPGWIADENLPVTLPEVESYEPTGTGESPLANIKDWVSAQCPKCGGPAKRETNTMPQWAGSSWYYLRFIDPDNDKALVNKGKDKYWSPVDFYVGGAEHATRHLIYARFWHKFLYDIGVVNYEEPFTRLRHVGLIMAEDGRKMSKRWGNVINPDDIVEKYGADAMRVYEMFMGPFSQSCAWSAKTLIGARRFLEKIWRLKSRALKSNAELKNKNLQALLHKTIKKVGEDIENFKFNTAIAFLMVLVNAMEKEKELSQSSYQTLIILLAPFAPHLAEEIWERLGNRESVFKQDWPIYNLKLIQDKKIQLVVQVNGRLRARIEAPAGILKKEAEKLAREDSRIQKWLREKEVIKIIFIPDKLINFVVR